MVRDRSQAERSAELRSASLKLQPCPMRQARSPAAAGSQQGVGWEGKHLKVTACEDTSNKARSCKVTRPVGHAPAGQLQVSEPTVGQIYLEKIHHIQLRAVGSAALRVRDTKLPRQSPCAAVRETFHRALRRSGRRLGTRPVARCTPASHASVLQPSRCLKKAIGVRVTQGTCSWQRDITALSTARGVGVRGGRGPRHRTAR